VKHKGEVAKVGLVALLGRSIQVVVLGAVGGRLDGAVLARQVTDLARLGLGRVALDLGARSVGIEVTEGGSTVAVLGDSRLVEVVGLSRQQYAHGSNSLVEHTEWTAF